MDTFSECRQISVLIDGGEYDSARARVIQLLENTRGAAETDRALLNHLIRSVGLYPYVAPSDATWDDRFAVEAFKSDVGLQEPVALHIEQAKLLDELLTGASVAVSAPTSFGKSFVIDAFIATRRPDKVLVIVPTIALMDETRRRLQRKFSHTHRVVTGDVEGLESYPFILVCPQERAVGLASRINDLDLLVVDEFYKASSDFDRDRSATLVRAIIKFSSVAKQRYFLAPNVSSLVDGPLTAGMKFIKLDFNTVLLKTESFVEEIRGEERKKVEVLRRILDAVEGQTLIYAGTYSQVDVVASLLRKWARPSGSSLLKDFARWLRENYGAEWKLPELVSLGVGVHNGQLHRPLSQIQVRLFEELNGLQTLISTSSIIEGVNTSAQNVVLWSAKNGAGRITDFDYRNIAGRSGRMFRHFVGNVYVLDQPPPAADTQLSLVLPDCLLGLPDVESLSVTAEQETQRDSFRGDLAAVMPASDVSDLLSGRQLQSSDTALIRLIAQRIAESPSSFRATRFLLADDPEKWITPLYRILDFAPAQWDAPHRSVVAVVKVLASNWGATVPDMLKQLADEEVGVEKFFKLERLVSYRLASLVSDFNAIHAKIVPDRGFDVSPFAAKLSNAFLPAVVSSLEEYGLPRMMCRIFQNIGLVNFEDTQLTVEAALQILRDNEQELLSWSTFGEFERYLLRYFFDGIRSS